MPKNLTGNAAAFPTQTSPLAGEPRTAGGVEAGFQNAADRTAFLNDRLIFLDPDRSGARRARHFASVAEMKAATDFPDKSVALIDGVGFYQFDAASVLVEASPAVITPTSVGAGPGRWLAAWFGSFNVANGIPQLDSSGKVPTSLLAAASGGKILGSAIKNGRVDFQFANVLSTEVASTTTATTLTDIPTPQLNVDAVNGDMLRVTASFLISNSSGNAEGQISVVAPTLGTFRLGDVVYPATSSPVRVTATGVIPINETGIYVVKIQHRVTSIGTSSLSVPCLTAELIRP